MLLVGKAQNLAIGAKIIEKSLLVSHDPGLFRFSHQLDHVALLSVALSIDERINKTGGIALSSGTAPMSSFVMPAA